GAVDVQHLVALCQARLGNHSKAEKAFKRALKISQRDPHLHGNFASLLRAMGRHDESLRHYRKSVELDPNLLQSWVHLGMVAMESGRTAQALAALERAVEIQPDSSYAWHVLGNSRRASGDLEGAEIALRRTVELAPDNSRAWVNLGIVIRHLGRPLEAQTCFEAARKAGFTGPELIDAESGVLIDLGEIEEAHNLVGELINAYPRYSPGHVTRAHLLWQYGPSVAPNDEPVGLLEEAATAQPDNGALQLAYVGFLLELRGAENVEKGLVKIRELRADQDFPLLGALEANALELLDRSDEAGRLYEKSYQSFGRKDPSFLNAYTRHLLKAGKWDVAALKAEEATRLDPVNQEAWAYLGTAWRLLDDPREYWLMDYDKLVALVEVAPPDGYEGMSEFLAALTGAVEPLHKASREPIEQSLRGGSQTAGRLFGHPDPVIGAAQQVLTRAIEKHIASLPLDDTHPYLGRKARSVRMTGSWSVKLWSAGKHVNHIHSDGWMSSAFYVSLPGSVAGSQDGNGQAGWIKFGQPPDELALELPPRRTLCPAEGRIALFPSYMWHGTVPFEDVEPRITVAFDMLPTT
ncbi:MAG: tetratricopeptide repeat protein, partial [Pseudomonadales bacterium]